MRMLPPALTCRGKTPLIQARRSVACARTLYILLHPEDESRRGEALSTIASKVLHERGAQPAEMFVSESLTHCNTDFTIDDLYRNSPDDATAEELIRKIAQKGLTLASMELFLPAGGFGAVARARGTDFVIR